MRSNQLRLFMEIIAIFCENHMEHIKTLCGKQNSEFLAVKARGTYSYHCHLKGLVAPKPRKHISPHATHKNSVPNSQRTRCFFIMRSNQLRLFMEIIAIFCGNHMEHIKTLCGKQNSEFLAVKARGTYSYHCHLKGLVAPGSRKYISPRDTDLPFRLLPSVSEQPAWAVYWSLRRA
jgi:hypothetical protein